MLIALELLKCDVNLISIVLYFLSFSMLVSCEKKDEPLPDIPAFSETIASSPSYGDQPYYGMSSTWNGRYITKVVRYGNDVGADEPGIIRLYKKSGDQSWVQGEATSFPGYCRIAGQNVQEVR